MAAADEDQVRAMLAEMDEATAEVRARQETFLYL